MNDLTNESYESANKYCNIRLYGHSHQRLLEELFKVLLAKGVLNIDDINAMVERL